MLTIKVGVMPGKLQEVVVEEGGRTAREIFEIADVVVSNHEVRLDGEVISLDSVVNSGKLLVAMKQIKGNVKTIKVGTMPGKLQEIETTGNETASELFNRAGITLSNHEIRLDGNVISEDSVITEGKLLVSMKQIKGNADIYITTLEEDEIEYLLDERLPQVLSFEDIEMDQLYVTIQGKYIVDKEMFFSVYEEGVDMGDTMAMIEPVQEEHVCKCKNAVDVIESKIRALKEDLTYYDTLMDRKRSELYILQDVLKEIQ